MARFGKIFFLLVVCGSLYGQIATNVSNGNSFTNLSDAWTNAANGDEIRVQAVTLTRENGALRQLNFTNGAFFTNKINMRIVGGYSSDWATITGYTTLDGSNAAHTNRLLFIKACSNLYLANFVLQGGGSATNVGATIDGSGMHASNVTNNMYSNIIVSNCVSLNGGGIRFGGIGNTLYATVIGCTATNGGGGVYMVGSNNALYGFIGTNTAWFGGGGVYMHGGTNNTMAASVWGNLATNGGGVYVWAGFTNTVSGDIAFNYASNNKQILGGGGMFVNTANALQITALVRSNTARGCGGGILMTECKSNVFTGNVLSNVCLGTSDNCGGGGFYLYGGEWNNIIGGLTANNIMSGGEVGGGVLLWGNSYTFNGIIASNTASGDGGGVGVIDGLLCTVSASFISNTTSGNGGAWSGGGSNTFTGYFLNNRASLSGGALYLSGSGNNIGGTYLSNSCNLFGGALWMSATFSYISGSYVGNAIVSNAASANIAGGGGIYLNSSAKKNTITNATVAFNTASSAGGGIRIAGASNWISNCTVASNTAVQSGSGFYLNGSYISVENTAIYNNVSSNSNGGGVLITASDNIIFTNCQITSNFSALYGGGVYNFDSAAPSTNSFIGCNVSSNSATYGGGFYYNNAFSNQALQCQVNSNTATFGGGIYIVNGSANGVQRCNFISNSSPTIVASNADYSFLVDCNILTSGTYISNDGTSDSNSLSNNYYGTICENSIMSNMGNMLAVYLEPFRLSRVGITQATITMPQPPIITNIVIPDRYSSSIISWTNIDASNGFHVFRSSTNGYSALTAPVGATLASIWTDTAPGTNYYYVTAYDASTPFSNESFFGVASNFVNAYLSPFCGIGWCFESKSNSTGTNTMRIILKKVR